MVSIISKETQLPITKEFYVLGTIIQLTVYKNEDVPAIKEAIDRLVEIDDKMSFFKDYSEISKINKNAGSTSQQVSMDTYFVIEKALYYSKLSKGAFDITIRPVVSLWGIGSKHPQIPNDDEIKNRLKLVNYKNIVMDKNTKSIRLKHKKQCIDLGSIAKGYAADEVKKIFIRNNVTSAMINLGGNVFALGNKSDGSLWNIGIQDPLKSRGEYVGIVSFADKSVVTSGNYERYFISNGKKYHHIIDPNTGYPSDNGVISATIISEKSIDGDALSTCAYVMGLKKGLKLINSIDGVEGIFITEDKKIYTTLGIKNNFKLTNKAYTLY